MVKCSDWSDVNDEKSGGKNWYVVDEVVKGGGYNDNLTIILSGMQLQLVDNGKK